MISEAPITEARPDAVRPDAVRQDRQGTTIKGTSITVTGDIATARTWLDRAASFERGKVFCQVMAGFEISALWKTAVKNGGDRKSDEAQKSEYQIGTLISREQVLEALNLSHSQAYRLMEMSKACATRLRKLPQLKGFDPVNQPIALLPAPQQEALQSAVQKLTDGITQREFGETMGLWKKGGGHAEGRKPGEGGRKKLSLAEQAELLQLQAEQDWSALATGLLAYGPKFTVLTDEAATAQIALLERHLTARKTWLKQPRNARDPQAIAALLTL